MSEQERPIEQQLVEEKVVEEIKPMQEEALKDVVEEVQDTNGGLPVAEDEGILDTKQPLVEEEDSGNVVEDDEEQETGLDSIFDKDDDDMEEDE